MSDSKQAPLSFIDLQAQYRELKSSIDARIHAVLDHGQYILGPEVAQLEERLAARVGVRHCVSCSSGTDALLLALMALGIGPGDEVITSPFTFFATGEMIALLGAVPVMVDIEPDTYNIDPDLIEAAITGRTRAIMPVSLYGQPAEMDAINAVAAEHNLPVIEDAAQSFGAVYKGRASCGLSSIGCTSFFPSKPLGAYGDGGACFTDDEALALRMHQLRNHGQEMRYRHTAIGINGRLDTLQAAILLAKLDVFDRELIARGETANAYNGSLLACSRRANCCACRRSAKAVRAPTRSTRLKSKTAMKWPRRWGRRGCRRPYITRSPCISSLCLPPMGSARRCRMPSTPQSTS